MYQSARLVVPRFLVERRGVLLELHAKPHGMGKHSDDRFLLFSSEADARRAWGMLDLLNVRLEDVDVPHLDMALKQIHDWADAFNYEYDVTILKE